MHRFWLGEYVPQLHQRDAARFPALSTIGELLGGRVQVTPVPIALDCTDGFTEAYYGRPECLLRRDVRAAQSAWRFVDDDAADDGLRRLAADLADGTWDERYGGLRTQATFHGSLRLVTSIPE
jgi:hypothetical protein